MKNATAHTLQNGQRLAAAQPWEKEKVFATAQECQDFAAAWDFKSFKHVSTCYALANYAFLVRYSILGH